jgi:hypothetical protein
MKSGVGVATSGRPAAIFIGTAINALSDAM